MKVYIAATRQNDGKTITSVGLLGAMKKRVKSVGYIKPVGQHYVEVDGSKIDKDAVLMSEVYKLSDRLEDMSPIAVPHGFTEEYILRGKKEDLVKRIQAAWKRVSAGKDFVLVEGTGHAGVGSVFDMSNSEVAQMLGVKIVLVSCGGIGRPIDEIMLNKAVFDQSGVPILGVIINKVRPDKYEKVNELVRKGLSRKGIEVLGVIPFDPVLSSPTLRELLEDIEDAKLLSGEEGLDNVVSKIVIGAMPSHDALNYFATNTLLITPGNRDDIILAAMTGYVPGVTEEYSISGIVLTCGIKPHRSIDRLLKRADIPVFIVPDDTFAFASKITNLIVKIRPNDIPKIRATEALIEKYVDLDKIFQLLKG